MEHMLRRTLLRQDVPINPTVEAIREVCGQMQAVENRFSQETDPDLIEGCIYEMEALRAQYRHLLRLAREQGITYLEQTPLWGE